MPRPTRSPARDAYVQRLLRERSWVSRVVIWTVAIPAWFGMLALIGSLSVGQAAQIVLALTSALVVIAGVIGTEAWLWIRDHRKLEAARQRGRKFCAACGYDLRGLLPHADDEEVAYPECANRYTRDGLAVLWRPIVERDSLARRGP